MLSLVVVCAGGERKSSRQYGIYPYRSLREINVVTEHTDNVLAPLPEELRKPIIQLSGLRNI